MAACRKRAYEMPGMCRPLWALPRWRARCPADCPKNLLGLVQSVEGAGVSLPLPIGRLTDKVASNFNDLHILPPCFVAILLLRSQADSRGSHYFHDSLLGSLPTKAVEITRLLVPTAPQPSCDRRHCAPDRGQAATSSSSVWNVKSGAWTSHK